MLERLTAELRGRYAPHFSTLYKALQAPSDFGGLLVYVADAPELTHRATLQAGALTMVWGKGPTTPANVVRLTRAGLNGLLKWDMKTGEIEQLEGDLTRLWAVQDEARLKALLAALPSL